MPVDPGRVLSLQRRKAEITGGIHKTVHVEKRTFVDGNSSFRPGVSRTEFSVLVDPPPTITVASEEDVSGSGSNVSLGDYVFELAGDNLTEYQLKNATHISLNRGQSDEELLSIQQFRPGDWIEQGERTHKLAVVGGVVIQWKVFARATKSGI